MENNIKIYFVELFDNENNVCEYKYYFSDEISACKYACFLWLKEIFPTISGYNEFIKKFTKLIRAKKYIEAMSLHKNTYFDGLWADKSIKVDYDHIFFQNADSLIKNIKIPSAKVINDRMVVPLAAQMRAGSGNF